jgi:hypothetical protein
MSISLLLMLLLLWLLLMMLLILILLLLVVILYRRRQSRIKHAWSLPHRRHPLRRLRKRLLCTPRRVRRICER